MQIVNAEEEVTIPQLLKRNCQRWGDQVWMRNKKAGLWREYTWKEGYEEVKHFSLGLISLGFERGEILGILGDNDPEWFWAEIGAQAAGGAVAGMRSDSSPDEVKAIVQHCQAKFVVAQDQEQVDKMLQIEDELPLLRRVIYWYGKGMKHYDDPILMSFDQVLELGRSYDISHPGLFNESIAQVKGDDLAIIQYTPGNTGSAEGIRLAYVNLHAANNAFCSATPVFHTDDWLSFILPGWVVEQGVALMSSLNHGVRMNFPENQETVQQDMREIGPSLVCYPSMLWEMLASNIQSRMSGSTFVKRFLYNLFFPVGCKIADFKLEGRRPNLFWRGIHGLSDVVLFRPLKARLGLGKTRCLYTFGSALQPDTFRMLLAHGLSVRQLYISGSLAELEVEPPRQGR